MNNPLLVRMLHRLADLDEQSEAIGGGKMILLAEVRDLDAAHQFHNEERPAALRGTRMRLCSPIRDLKPSTVTISAPEPSIRSGFCDPLPVDRFEQRSYARAEGA